MSAAAFRPPCNALHNQTGSGSCITGHKTFAGNSGCSGQRNPSPIIPNRLSGFLSSQSASSPDVLLRLPGVHSTSSTSTLHTFLSSSRKRLEVRTHRRIQPSSWLLVVLRTTGHCGHGVFRLWPTGGFGIISICVTLSAPDGCLFRYSHYPYLHLQLPAHACLLPWCVPPLEYAARPACVLLCQHLHGKMEYLSVHVPGYSNPACLRRTRTNAGMHPNPFGRFVTSISALTLKVIQCFPSLPHGGRLPTLLGLKFGIPNRKQASHYSSFSNTVTAYPLRFNWLAAASPQVRNRWQPPIFRFVHIDEGLYVPFTKSGFNDGSFIFTNGYRCIHTQLQHQLFSHPVAGDIRPVNSENHWFSKYLISFFPFSFVHGILELRRTITQRTCPMAERYPTVHTTAMPGLSARLCSTSVPLHWSPWYGRVPDGIRPLVWERSEMLWFPYI